jgi:type IV secretion system protein VirB6
MTPCPDIMIKNSGAQSMVEAVDCFVKTSAQDGYAALLGSGSIFNQALTILLTLYVGVIGYKLIFGHTSLALRDLAPKMLMIGVVLALSTSWSAYQVLVFDLLTDGPQEIAQIIDGRDASAPSLMARVDTLTSHMVAVADAWSGAAAAPAPATVGPTPAAQAAAAAALPVPVAKSSMGPNLLLLSTLLLLLASAGILVVAKVLLGLILALGPVFIVLALFDFTRALALGWLRVGVLLAIVPLLTLMTTFGALNLLEPLVADMVVEAANDVFDLKSATTLLVVTLVISAVGLQLFRLATHLTANWQLPFARLQNLMQSSPETTVPNPQPDVRPAGGNERIDVLINAIERISIAAPSAVADTTIQRILLPDLPQDQIDNRAGNDAARRMAAGSSANTGRGLLRPVRGAT